jgi:hypothetical protein
LNAAADEIPSRDTHESGIIPSLQSRSGRRRARRGSCAEMAHDASKRETAANRHCACKFCRVISNRLAQN